MGRHSLRTRGQDRSFGPPSYYFTSDTTLCPPELIHPIEDLRGQYNFTFIENPDLYERTTELMLKMQPSIRKIVMLADASYHNRHLASETRDYIEKNHPGLEYEWLISKDDNVSEMQSYLTNYNPEVGLLLCSWFYGRTGTLGYREILSGGVNLIPSVEQPVFTLRESYLENGAVGGYFADSRQIKQSIISAVHQMLDGIPMNEIPFLFKKDLNTQPIIDYSLLETNHLNPALCPSNTCSSTSPYLSWKSTNGSASSA